MTDFLNFLFGAGALKKAAQTGETDEERRRRLLQEQQSKGQPPPPPAYNMADEAAKQAALKATVAKRQKSK
jgi:hypothetical protein